MYYTIHTLIYLIPKIAQSASWQLIGSMKSRAMRCAGGEKEDGFIRFLQVIQRIQRGHSMLLSTVHPALKRQDRLGKEPFAGFGTVVEGIAESGYTKNQPILLGAF